MKPRIILFILLGLFHMNKAKGQVKNSDFYVKAYNYLNDSIIKTDDIKNLVIGCEGLVYKLKANGKSKKVKLKFNNNLQVAEKYNNHKKGFPLEDYVRKKYNLSDECIKALRLGTRTCSEVNNIKDSLFIFWEDYSMKSEKEIRSLLSELPSDRKDGYQVFFSDIFKNTLSAELKSFCTPYDSSTWQGSSTFFFFVFDEKGIIKEVYSGKTIHYN
ncbi:hypothetical protein KMW28_24355 [Flammeovirga yaeyamensis]|uniref:Lipoprotein n=1 Tax=Flammeovirga yaeyamensis TaxID=367791 RepID=A0AAX1ND50_9BACT|nr:hypothetical protein [Flammeovirga yaeyamensis]MBB3699582.1 hypothetical protein [Flammeovirga yaeyamensis]NMF35163.1 hypothetical protein [Flammeovirga yaeyamensis]QWG04027.1 hypothetical protein KMW28_24355 [Flammeovirga yaeyamensis]